MKKVKKIVACFLACVLALQGLGMGKIYAAPDTESEGNTAEDILELVETVERSSYTIRGTIGGTGSQSELSSNRVIIGTNVTSETGNKQSAPSILGDTVSEGIGGYNPRVGCLQFPLSSEDLALEFAEDAEATVTLKLNSTGLPDANQFFRMALYETSNPDAVTPSNEATYSARNGYSYEAAMWSDKKIANGTPAAGFAVGEEDISFNVKNALTNAIDENKTGFILRAQTPAAGCRIYNENSAAPPLLSIKIPTSVTVTCYDDAGNSLISYTGDDAYAYGGYSCSPKQEISVGDKKYVYSSGNIKNITSISKISANGTGNQIKLYYEEVIENPPNPQVTSEVDLSYTEYDRQVLKVDGEPFFYNGIQIRIDKLKDVYKFTDDQIKNLFQVAKDDGFTVVNAQIRWSDIQPDQSVKATESTYISGADATANFAAEDHLKIEYDAEGINHSLGYIKFDIAELKKQQAKWDGAKIRFYGGGTGQKLNVYGLEDDSWDAETLNWDNAPGHSGYTVEGSGVHVLSVSPEYDKVNDVNYYDFDVTDFVNAYGDDGTVSLVLQAAEDVSGTIQFDKTWTELVVSQKDVYDWSYLDKVIGWAEDAGIKLEILWFATDTCSVTIDSRVPLYVFNNYQKSLTDEELPFFKKQSGDPGVRITGTYWYLMCKNDMDLRAKEKQVIKDMFDHVARYNASASIKNTIIGCQVANEPQIGKLHGSSVKNSNGQTVPHCMCDNCISLKGSMGNQAFRDKTMWEYTNNLAAGVKESDYSVWTRINNVQGTDAEGVAYNEQMRATTGTNVDYIGIDPYGQGLNYFYNLGHSSIYARFGNLPMVMEMGGEDDRTPKFIMKTLAGGGFYNVYDLCSPDGHSLYDGGVGQGDNIQPHGAYVEELRNTNKMLNKISYDLAVRRPDGAFGTTLKYFNDTGTAAEEITKQIRGIDVTYKTDNGGTGIAIEKNSKEISLVSTTASKFTLKGLGNYQVETVEEGYYEGQQWVKTNDLSYQAGTNLVIDMPAYGCVRVTTQKVIPAIQSQINYEAEMLSYHLSEGVTNEVWNDGASNGYWVKVFPNEVGDFVEFTLNVPNKAKYQVYTGYRAGGTRGTVQLSIDNEEYGTPIDMYRSNAGYLEASAGTLNLEGKHTFRYTLTDKNTGSTGFDMGFDYIKLIPEEEVNEIYSVNINQSVGGKITANPMKAEKGQEVKLTVTPNSMYKVTDLCINGNSVFGASLLDADGTVTYTLPDVQSDINVTAGFALMNNDEGGFALFDGNIVSDIYVSDDDFSQIKRAAGDLKEDINSVTGNMPEIKTSGSAPLMIIAGSVEKNQIIQDLMAAGKLDEVKDLQGKWEAFVMKVVDNPVAGCDKALVIAGSDKRGTIYGIYEMSQQMGISPYHWWADVAPVELDKIILHDGLIKKEGEPTVKYRGIFINDERNLWNWSAQFKNDLKDLQEASPGQPNAAVYKKVYELLLRLKLNALWPAMHEYSDEFNKYTYSNGEITKFDPNGIPINAYWANEYGIMMGSSHCEPMLSNSVDEAWDIWKEQNAAKYGRNLSYDYTKNPDALLAYWRERVESNKEFDNIYTLGMRGRHDGGLSFGGLTNPTTAQKVAVLEEIITEQRKILVDVLGKPIEEIPQVFIPYKEVADLYNAGLQVPEDVILMWAEDNHGQLRQVPTEAERTRSGGAGIYYHVSYWGSPRSYLWINTTPLSHMYEECRKAYDTGAANYWILNVGDIKPSEISLEFFAEMARDINKYDDSNISNYVQKVASRDFLADEETANEISDIMNKYYQYNIAKRPEFQGYENSDGASLFSLINYGDEGQIQVNRLNDLFNRAKDIYENMDPVRKDAFYEMVYYPIRVSKFMLEKNIYHQKHELYAKQGRYASVIAYADASKAAYQSYQDDLKYFNNDLQNGKWNKIINPNVDWIPQIKGVLSYTYPTIAGTGLGTVCEGQETGNENITLKFSSLTNDRRFLDVFTKGKEAGGWTITPSSDFIKLSKSSGNVQVEERVWISIDWDKLSSGVTNGTVRVTGPGLDKTFNVSAEKIDNNTITNADYVEANGYVAIEAEHFSRSIAAGGSEWKLVKNWGRVGDSMRVYPDVARRIDITEADFMTKSARLEYKVYFKTAGTHKVTLYRNPTLNEGSENGVTRSARTAIGINNSIPVLARGSAQTSAGGWKKMVLEHTDKITEASITVPSAGVHTLAVYKSDPSIGFDRIVVNTGGEVTSYYGPPESYNSKYASEITPAPISLLPENLDELYLASDYEAPDRPEPAYFMESFNEYTIGNFTDNNFWNVFGTGGSNKLEIVANPANPEDKLLHINRSSGSLGIYNKEVLNLSGVFTVETRLKRSSTQNNQYSLYTYANNYFNTSAPGSSTNPSATIAMVNGKIRSHNVRDASTTVDAGSYAADKWYLIQNVVNMNTGTYDFYIDGEKVLSNQPLRTWNASLVIDRLSLYGADADGDLYADFINVFEGVKTGTASLPYILELQQSTGGSLTASRTEVEKTEADKSVTLTAKPAIGYRFKEIKLNGTAVNATEGADGAYTYTLNVENDISVSVSYEKLTEPGYYGVNIQQSAGGSVTADKEEVREGEAVKLTVTPDIGYKVKEIRVNESAVNATADASGTFTYTVTNVTEHLTITARFEVLEVPEPTYYTVTVQTKAGGLLTADKMKVKEGASVKLTATPTPGYRVNEIKVNGKAVNATADTNGVFTYTVENVMTELTVTATFERLADSDNQKLVPGMSTTHKIGYLWYQVTKSAELGGTVMVTKADTKTRKTIKIPNKVNINGYIFKVTEIKKKAFQKNKKLKTVKVGDNVKIIGASAFANCPRLNKVTVGKGLTTINSKAFYKDKNLKKLIIKTKKLKTVRKKAFNGINKKAIIDVPNSKVKKYKRICKNKGQAKTVKIR